MLLKKSPQNICRTFECKNEKGCWNNFMSILLCTQRIFYVLKCTCSDGSCKWFKFYKVAVNTVYGTAPPMMICLDVLTSIHNSLSLFLPDKT